MGNVFTKVYNALFAWEPTPAATKGIEFTSPSNQQPLSRWESFSVPQSRVDYQNLVGDPLRNSAFMAAVRWVLRMYPQAPLTVERQNAKREWEIDYTHPLTALFDAPNPDYDGNVLRAGIDLSLMLNGNAYILVNYNALGLPAELYYIPHTAINPDRPNGGFTYSVNGHTYELPRTRVIHIRDGIDPKNIRKGLNAFASLLREIATDNEATTFTATLLRNMGVPSVLISPKDADTSFGNDAISEEGTAAQIKAMFQELTTGDHRGEALIQSVPIQIDRLGFDPQQMNLDSIHDLPEERISAVTGIPEIVLNFGRGLDAATYSNYGMAEGVAIRQNMLPVLNMEGQQIGNMLLPLYEVEPKRTRVRFDTSGLAALQESQDALYTRNSGGFAAGWLKRSEVRTAAKLPVTPDDDVYYVPNTGTLRNPDGTPVIEPMAAPPPPLALNADPTQVPPQLPNAGKTFRLNAPYVDAQNTRVLE